MARWRNDSMRVYTITAKENVKVSPSWTLIRGAEPWTRVILNNEWIHHSKCF